MAVPICRPIAGDQGRTNAGASIHAENDAEVPLAADNAIKFSKEADVDE